MIRTTIFFDDTDKPIIEKLLRTYGMANQGQLVRYLLRQAVNTEHKKEQKEVKAKKGRVRPCQ